MKKITLGLVVAALLAISAATAMTASAAPIIIRETVTTPFSETGIPHDCRPGITGTLAGIDTLSSQSVETSQGFHIQATDTATGRIDWSDGSYTLIESVDHFSFNNVGNSTTNVTNTHADSGDFYSAAGVFEFRLTVQDVKHFTITDGVVRVDMSKGHFHFFGDC